MWHIGGGFRILDYYIKLIHMVRIVFGSYHEESCGHEPLWSAKRSCHGSAMVGPNPKGSVKNQSLELGLKDHKEHSFFSVGVCMLL